MIAVLLHPEFNKEYFIVIFKKKKMEKKKKTSNARAQIVDMVHELRQMGKTIAEIAMSVNRSVSTVKRILTPT